MCPPRRTRRAVCVRSMRTDMITTMYRRSFISRVTGAAAFFGIGADAHLVAAGIVGVNRAQERGYTVVALT